MTIRDMFVRLRRQPARTAPRREWTASLTPRDWADLPTYHPRREDDAL